MNNGFTVQALKGKTKENIISPKVNCDHVFLYMSMLVVNRKANNSTLSLETTVCNIQKIQTRREMTKITTQRVCLSLKLQSQQKEPSSSFRSLFDCSFFIMVYKGKLIGLINKSNGNFSRLREIITQISCSYLC